MLNTDQGVVQHFTVHDSDSCCRHRLVEDNPEVLNVAAFQKTLQHARDMMGADFDVIDTLKRSPKRIFQFQQGKDIIPYDEVPTQQPPG